MKVAFKGKIWFSIILLIVLVCAFLYVALVNHDPPLEEVPIYVGSWAFNDSSNSDLVKSIEHSWSSEDFFVSDDGNFRGTVETVYTSSYASNWKLITDVLFIQVRGDYVGKWGDHTHPEFSNYLPFKAILSSQDGARFVTSGYFNLPSTTQTLEGIQVNFTWVRVFKNETEEDLLNFQILPGTSYWSESVPSMAFNQELKEPISGVFYHYESIIPETNLHRGGEIGADLPFNYRTWINENITIN